MKLNTKSRYAVQAMVDIACNGDSKPCSLSHISIRQNISLSYLEQIFNKLKKSKLVKSHRGPGGGYKLIKSSSDINIAEIINAVDDNIKATGCGHDINSSCTGKSERCITHNLWEDLENLVEDYLNSIVLSDVANKKNNNILEMTINE